MCMQEVECDNPGCDRIAKVRVIKKELIRIHNRDSIGVDVNRYYNVVTAERFLCMLCAHSTDYTIVEWLVNKISAKTLFGVDGFSMKDADDIGVKYVHLLDEKALRWYEQKFCQNCGHKLVHEIRYYSDDSGYDSPDRWVNAHKIVHCKNCGFFDFEIRHKQFGHSRKDEDDGKYHGWRGPSNDTDYKIWQKTLKELKEKEAEE